MTEGGTTREHFGVSFSGTVSKPEEEEVWGLPAVSVETWPSGYDAKQ